MKTDFKKHVAEFLDAKINKSFASFVKWMKDKGVAISPGDKELFEKCVKEIEIERKNRQGIN
jgi:hypothetical protein